MTHFDPAQWTSQAENYRQLLERYGPYDEATAQILSLAYEHFLTAALELPNIEDHQYKVIFGEECSNFANALFKMQGIRSKSFNHSFEDFPTRITISCNLKDGDRLFIRGYSPENILLNWKLGMPLEQTSEGEWSWRATNPLRPGTNYQFFINDTACELGAPRVIIENSIDLTPPVFADGLLPQQDCRSALLEKLPYFVKLIAKLSPPAANALRFTIHNTPYRVWYNPINRAVSIQEEEIYILDLTVSGLTNEKQKLDIYPQANDTYTFKINNSPAQLRDLQDRAATLLELINMLDNQILEKEQMAKVNELLPPSLLMILQQILPCQNDGEEPLTIGDIKIWTRKLEQEKIIGRYGKETLDTKKFIINIQSSAQWRTHSQIDKLGIGIESETGKITSIHINGCQIPQESILTVLSQICSEGNIWHSRIGKLIDDVFPRLVTVENGFYGPKVDVHPYAIVSRPEQLLASLCRTGSFQRHTVYFLHDNLTRTPGTDQGGLSRELIARLSSALLDGASQRTIKINQGKSLPTLELAATLQTKKTFNELGMLLGFCYASPDYITGEVLPHPFFTVIQQVGQSLELLKANIATQTLSIADPTYQWAWDLSLKEDHFPIDGDTLGQLTVLIQTITDNYDLTEEDVLGMDRRAIKNHIADFLMESYQTVVLAAIEIGKGMRAQLGDIEWQRFLRSSSKDCSEKIMGLFDKEKIKQKILIADFMSAEHRPIIEQRTQWLKDLFDMVDTVTAKKVIQGITGVPNLLTDRCIRVSCTNQPIAAIHTCSLTIDLPYGEIHPVTPSQGALEGDSEKIKFLNMILFSTQDGGFTSA